MPHEPPDLMNQAKQFRQIMNQPTVFSPTNLSTQFRLIKEEFEEFSDALEVAVDHLTNKRAREEALKELADLAYVCFQMAAAAGWELDVALDRVHESNLSKLVDGKPVKREDGKVLKGPNYHPPVLIDLV